MNAKIKRLIPLLVPVFLIIAFVFGCIAIGYKDSSGYGSPDTLLIFLLFSILVAVVHFFIKNEKAYFIFCILKSAAYMFIVFFYVLTASIIASAASVMWSIYVYLLIFLWPIIIAELVVNIVFVAIKKKQA